MVETAWLTQDTLPAQNPECHHLWKVPFAMQGDIFTDSWDWDMDAMVGAGTLFCQPQKPLGLSETYFPHVRRQAR